CAGSDASQADDQGCDAPGRRLHRLSGRMTQLSFLNQSGRTRPMRQSVATSPTGINLTRRQSAALPFRQQGGKLEVMLITSRRTGRWGVPKGGIQAGMTPWESAAEEAAEEAGVV